MNKLTPDELDFLATWLMHYGGEWTDRFDKSWYGQHPVSCDDPTVRGYFTNFDGETKINERGLAAIEQGVKQK